MAYLVTGLTISHHDSLAQLVEHLTLNQQVRGSIPRWVTILLISPSGVSYFPFLGDKACSGRLAQLGERLPYKQDVSSSILLSPTNVAR